MSTALIIYPYCHIKCTDKQLLVIDTLSHNYVYLKTNPLSFANRNNIQCGFVVLDEDSIVLAEQCIKTNLGYYVDFTRTIPFMYQRTLDFISSLTKERRSLGFNLQSSTNILLKSVNLLLNNSCNVYPKDAFIQMEYPDYNAYEVDFNALLYQLTPFPYLNLIVLSGETSIPFLKKVLDFSQIHNISVLHRIIYDSCRGDSLLEIQDVYNNYTIEYLINGSMDINNLPCLNNRIIYKAIISSLNDYTLFSSHKGIEFSYLPVLSFNENEELILQMLMSKEEILRSSMSIKDCLLADFYNTSTFGNLVINYDGTILCHGDKVATIQDGDLAFIINKWVGQDNCSWFSSRKKKDNCRDCALQCLCPPISIYEKLGLFTCPCSL